MSDREFSRAEPTFLDLRSSTDQINPHHTLQWNDKRTKILDISSDFEALAVWCAQFFQDARHFYPDVIVH